MNSSRSRKDAQRPSEDDSAVIPSRHTLPMVAVIGILVASVVIAGLLVMLGIRRHQQQNPFSSIRPTGIPATVSTPLADLMALSPVPKHTAPGFTLVDQNDRTLSLSSFKGRAVVLEFMDSRCVDICPIVSQEFIEAYHDLGGASSKVIFMAVNVNAAHAAVADVSTFSHEHGLDSLPSWHFFTGSPQQLTSVWRSYNVEVSPSGPAGDIVHSSYVYFIDPQGRERYLGAPTDDHTSTGGAYLPSGNLTSWGTGIALVARSLLPR